MQPTFLPWMGYIYMISKVDSFVFLDNVQFERSSWQSRNKIKLNDKPHLICLSCKKASLKTSLSNIELSKDRRWRTKLLKTFHHAYSKSLYYEKYASLIKKNLEENEMLVDLNISMIVQFCKDLHIKTPLLRASCLNLAKVHREELLLSICKILQAKSYLSPEGSKNYLESVRAKNMFKQSQIKVNYLHFTHPYYKQQGKNFIPYLSIIDFLFNIKNPSLEFHKIVHNNEGSL